MNRTAILVAFPLSMVLACGGETPPPPAPPPPPPPPTASAAPAPVDSAAMAASAPAADAGAGAPAAPTPAALTFKPVALPGVTPPASLDYIAFEPGKSRVWVPVGNTGSVDVYDTAAATFTRVDGFKTAEREYKGKKRTAGPSAVTIGDGFAYVGNRATSEICPVDLATLKPGKCLKMPSSTDGVAYVASAREVWVTTPRTQTIEVLDASKPGMLKAKASIKLDGDPEGYAVDASRGVFLTNLEDKNKTVVIDIATHKTKATWTPDCGSDGPRGIAAEVAHGFVLVACTDHIDILDGAHDGAQLGKVDTGAGVDNIDWSESSRRLYAAGGRAARATVAQIDDKGGVTIVASSPTTDGARNGVADTAGGFYVIDPVNARLLVFPPAP